MLLQLLPFFYLLICVVVLIQATNTDHFVSLHSRSVKGEYFCFIMVWKWKMAVLTADVSPGGK